MWRSLIKIQHRMNKKKINNKKSALNRLWQTMDDIAEKAAERGLTPEILETLLEKN